MVIWSRFLELLKGFPFLKRDDAGKNKPGMYFKVPYGLFISLKTKGYH
jgi:hypothetical protein